jgi:predicted house-cleaning noncanonical NTP pyrophosphatase (MazG superfamily)
MTIEERFEKLTERHEALTQTVEIMTAMQHENEQRMAQMMDVINRLANIAAAHEERLDLSRDT